MKKLSYIALSVTIIFFTCESEEDSSLSQGGNANNTGGSGSNSSSGWLIPQDEVFDGGPGKDGIPSLSPPIDVNDGSFLLDQELVLGYYDGTAAIAYPHQILDWHEIINDEVNGFPFAVTYCPLTGTGIGWERTLNGTITTFGVSGLLYNNNLIPYDRTTDSNWSQMRNDCVNGELQGQEVVTFPLVETTWKTWKTMYPSTQSASQSTSFNRQYGLYPYGDYKTNNDFLLFPLNPDDLRLPRKERVHGIISIDKAKVYRFESFGTNTTLIKDAFGGLEVIVVGNSAKNFIVSFEASLDDGTSPEFSAIEHESIILEDTEGNKWDIFGYAVEGPRTGQQLIPTKSYMGYWFAWGTFYAEPEIYE